MELLTPRLRLETLKPHHADAFFDDLQDARLYDYVADMPPSSIESLRDRYRALSRGQSPDGTEVWLNWAVWAFEEARHIGYVQATITATGGAIIAYVFFLHSWGKGYAREAVRRLIVYLCETYRPSELRAYVDVRNSRSIALLHALEFERVAVRKDAEMIHGVLTDEAEYRKGC